MKMNEKNKTKKGGFAMKNNKKNKMKRAAAFALCLVFAVSNTLAAEVIPFPLEVPVAQTADLSGAGIAQELLGNGTGNATTDFLMADTLLASAEEGSAAGSQELPTVLPAYRTVSRTGWANYSESRTAEGIRVDYQNFLDFVGIAFGYDDFSTEEIESYDFSFVGLLRFEIEGTMTRLKVEVVDADGRSHSDHYVITPGTEETTVCISMNEVAASGVDVTRVQQIFFVIEDSIVSDGYMEVHDIPVISATTDYDLTDVNLPTALDAITVAPSGASSMTTSFANGFSVDIATYSEGWAGAGMNYDDFSTSQIETANLSSQDSLIVGLGETDAPLTASRIKFELVDNQDRKAYVYLELNDAAAGVWEIPLSVFENSGIDLTRIRHIFYIAEGNDISGSLRAYSSYVPAGWTLANSNSRYAFREILNDSHSWRGPYNLELMDLTTDETRVLEDYYPPAGERGFGLYDVSPAETPGGEVVIYGLWNPYAGRYITTVERVNDPAQSYTITETGVYQDYPAIVGIEYLENGNIQLETQLHYGDGTVMGYTYEIDALTLTLAGEYANLIQGSDYFFEDGATDTAVHVDKYNGRIFFFDTTAGLSRMEIARTVELGDNTHAELLSASATETQGRRVLSVGLETETYTYPEGYQPASSQTMLYDFTTGQLLEVYGAMEEVTYYDRFALYRARNLEGEAFEFLVDLKTFSLIPCFEG